MTSLNLLALQKPVLTPGYEEVKAVMALVASGCSVLLVEDAAWKELLARCGKSET